MGRAALQYRAGGVSPPRESMKTGRAEGKDEEWRSLRHKPGRMENGTPDRIRHFCNVNAVGPAKVQGFGGLLRAGKASLDLPGKWVGAELWERSAAPRAKQTHSLAEEL